MLIRILAYLISIVAIVIFGIDYYFYAKERTCRYHIGRWKPDDWESAVVEVAKKWVIKTPVVKKTDNSRYMLFDFINGVYKEAAIQAWQKGSLILGLQDDNKIDDSWVKDVINESGQWKNDKLFIDSGMLGYAMLRGGLKCDAAEPAIMRLYQVIANATDDNGLVSYTGNKENPERYVDTLGMICPFLVKYGVTYKDDRAIKLSFNQLKYYHDNGLYFNTALPNHAINTMYNLPVGVYGWGRGVAWYIIGLMDSYKEFEEGQEKSSIEEWIHEAAESYREYQHEDGGFGSTIQRNQSTYDSSATAVLAWFYYECAAIFNNKEYINIGDRALTKLRTVTRRTGAIDWCQGDTKGIGIFAQTYDIMPFAQGFAVRALAARDRINKD